MPRENAAQRSAHHEAEALARRGLHALLRLPPSLERDQQELGLRFMLGVAVMANKGFAATEVKEVSEAALALCGRAETSSQAFRIQWLLFLFHYFRGQLRPAEEIARELVKLSETIGDPFFVFEAHRAAGANLLDQGHFNDALEHLEQVSALYDPKRRHESMTGQSPRVVAECVCARALWALGFPDAARQRVEGAVSLAEEFSRAESLVIASYFAAHLYQLRDEPAAARERAETVIGIAEEYGLPLWHAFGRMNRGWARMAQGEIAEGIDELRRGLAMSEATGATLWRPYYLGLLAQGLARLEHVDAAVAEITSALALVETTGEYLVRRGAQPDPGRARDPAGGRPLGGLCAGRGLFQAIDGHRRQTERALVAPESHHESGVCTPGKTSGPKGAASSRMPFRRSRRATIP